MHQGSTNCPSAAALDWRAAGLAYFHYNFFLRRRFGGRVQKVSVNAGFTCPNVDGTVAIGGCTFCDNTSFSPSRRVPRRPITEQIDDGIRRLKLRYKVDRFMAYFQPATNTYASVERLRRVYEEALAHPLVVGLAIGTRADCLPDEVVDLLAELARRTFLSVEIGVQTCHDRSLAAMNRGHDHATTVAAVERCRGRGFELCAHLILGLPGESREEMLQSAREVGRLGFDAVKIHNLYAVRRTPIGEQVARGELELMSLAEYVSIAVDCLEILPPQCLVERISGEAPPKYLVGPDWCLDKPAIRAALEAEFARRQTWQGRLFAEAANLSAIDAERPANQSVPGDDYT
ncbi:MAG: TIGR01212 family radical SAM protein [Pirellulales bacterium]|nr:TIGR01212 family radical SAM protein [Pirellulales bacterium]